MSPHKNNLTPKNYITSGISKNLLTPCRRVGLSRTKKTPKNVSVAPLTPIPNSTIKNTPPKSIHVEADRESRKLDETPKNINTPKKDRTLFNQIEKKTPQLEESSHGDETPKKPNTLKNERNLINKIENKTNQLEGSSLADEKPVTPNTLKKEETETQINNTKNSLNYDIAVNTQVVIADVHYSATKNNINFDKFNASIIFAQKEKETQPIHNNSLILKSSAEKNIVKLEVKEKTPIVKNTLDNRKRKFRLDSDDFSSNKDLKCGDFLKTDLSPRSKCRKESRTTISETANGITLGRFTTEDYLKEYSTNPKIFQENLESESSVNSARVTITYDDENDEDVFSISPKPKKIKNRSIKSSNCVHMPKKDYVAILCPTIDQSVVKQPRRSLSTKKSSLELKKLSKTSHSNLPIKKTLTVCLEPLTEENLKSKLNHEDDIDLYELPSTPEPISSIESKKSLSKINPDDENDDDLFTSSPQSDKKQHENLLKLIIDIEKQIKQKEDKLEKLRQAQVYKKKHSPEKLKLSSDKWLEGCQKGLNDLLIKMQEHGPMDMETLIKKLRIPDNIVKKLGVL